MLGTILSLFHIRQDTVVIVCHTFFNDASVGAFIPDKTSNADAILACAGGYLFLTVMLSKRAMVAGT